MEIDNDTHTTDHSGSHCTPSSSRKRKQPDEDEVLVPKADPLVEDQIDNEYEHLEDDDEEIDETNASKIDYDQIMKAQEAPTIAQYDDIKITPFNLEEELEEGEFDATGNFIFSKDKDKDKDVWADSINWSDVERQEKLRLQKLAESSSKTPKQDTNHEPSTSSSKAETQQPEPHARDRLSCYKAMLRILKPDETVQKAIRRLGNAIPRRLPQSRFTRTRQQILADASTESDERLAEILEIRRQLDLIIELAHQRLEDGDMDIYQKSYEDFEDAIN